MADDYISRQAAIDEFDGVKVNEDICNEYDIGYNDGIDFAISRLSVLPPADVKPVVRGMWIEQDDGWDGVYYECSVCKEPFVLIDGNPKDNLYNYCPNCGADMMERKTDV